MTLTFNKNKWKKLRAASGQLPESWRRTKLIYPGEPPSLGRRLRAHPGDPAGWPPFGERASWPPHVCLLSAKSGRVLCRLCTFVAPVTVGSRHRDKNIRQNTNLCIMGGNAGWLLAARLAPAAWRTFPHGGLQSPGKAQTRPAGWFFLVLIYKRARQCLWSLVKLLKFYMC